MKKCYKLSLKSSKINIVYGPSKHANIIELKSTLIGKNSDSRPLSRM